VQWAANQTSGATSTSRASFQLGSLTVSGVSIPIANDSAATVLALVNTALAPVGLAVTWPATSTQSDGTVVISPLSVGIDNSELGQELIGANLSQAQTVRSAVQQALLNLSCRTATELLVSDVGVGILAGGGGLDVSIGGAEAVTAASSSVSPFGPDPGALPSSGGLSPASSGDASTGVQAAGSLGDPLSDTDTGFGSASAPVAAASPGTAAKEALNAPGPVSTTITCRSLGPAGGGCNASDLAVPASIGAMALLGGLFAADYWRQRRFGPRRRKEPA
jgi:hypothetical protein